MDTTGEKKKRTSKKNVDGRSTSSHDNKKFRNRSMEKERNVVWFPEDGDSCYKTGCIDRLTMNIFITYVVPDVTLWNGTAADLPEENVQVQLDLECLLLHPRKKSFNIHWREKILAVKTLALLLKTD